MNCLSCDESLYEYDNIRNNCINLIKCEYSFYYVVENNIKTKVCLDDGQFCPLDLPYVLLTTKECISNCSYEQLIKQYCKPSNIEENYEEVTEILREEIISNENITNEIINDEFEDIVIQGNNITFEITTTSNQDKKILSMLNDNESTIDLGECGDYLKQKNNIPENLSLSIM